ncbi:MAG: hypothetical protein RSD64_04365, partial [Christensenellaceae bacterium]
MDTSHDTRVARDPVTGKTVYEPANMTYEEWYDKRVKSVPEAMEAERAAKIPEKQRAKMQSDTAQWQRYKDRLGDYAPPQNEFLRLKKQNGDEWIALQERYRYTGIVDRMVARNKNVVVCSDAGDITDAYKRSAAVLPKRMKDGIYHYTDYAQGVRMSKYLGNVPDITLSREEITNMKNTIDAVQNMTLP